MQRYLYIFALIGLAGIAAVERACGMAPPDTTYTITTSRVEDTVTVTIAWHRKERDRVDLRLDVLDMEGKLHKTYRAKVKVGDRQGAKVRFVLNPARELGLDSGSYYYGLSANVSCQCEELLRAVLPYPMESYSLPDPKLRIRVSRHNRKQYVALLADNLALGVHIAFSPSRPAWRAEVNDFDLLPGQDMEVEIEGIAAGEEVLLQAIRVTHLR
jgi:Ig-fold domain